MSFLNDVTRTSALLKYYSQFKEENNGTEFGIVINLD